MMRCECDARYKGCGHEVPCPTSPPSDRGNRHFCSDCDRRRIEHISASLEYISANFDRLVE